MQDIYLKGEAVERFVYITIIVILAAVLVYGYFFRGVCPGLEETSDVEDTTDKTTKSDDTTSPTPKENKTIIPEKPKETCSDGLKNQDETQVDCGGTCGGYFYDEKCNENPEPKKETCSDAIKNQNETEVDCGGVCGGFWYDDACHLVAQKSEADLLCGNDACIDGENYTACASDCQRKEKFDDLDIEINALITQKSAQLSPVLYRNKVFYLDINATTKNDDVVYLEKSTRVMSYDLSTNTVEKIRDYDQGTGPTQRSILDAYDVILTWIHSGDGYYYDSKTKKDPQEFSTKTQTLSIYGDVIAFSDDADVNGTDIDELFMIGVGEDEVEQLSNFTNHSTQPDIYKDSIAYRCAVDFPDDDEGDICVYDISSEENVAHINMSGNQVLPKIFDNTLVFKTDSTSTEELHYYHYTKEEDTVIDTTTGTFESYDIYGSYIVYVETPKNEDREDSTLYLYSIPEEEKFKLADNAAGVRIYDDKIVWEDYTSGKIANLYSAQIKD